MFCIGPLVERERTAFTYLDRTVLATGLQTQYPESLRDNHALLSVVGRRDALEQLEALQSSRAAGSLVGNHATDGAVEDLGGSAVMEGAGLFGVDDVALVEEVVVPQLREKIKTGLPRTSKGLKVPCCGRSCRKC